MAEFLIHRRSGMGFPANRAQGSVSCCPSITLITEGLIPMSGATGQREHRDHQLYFTHREATLLSDTMMTNYAIKKSQKIEIKGPSKHCKRAGKSIDAEKRKTNMAVAWKATNVKPRHLQCIQ